LLRRVHAMISGSPLRAVLVSSGSVRIGVGVCAEGSRTMVASRMTTRRRSKAEHASGEREGRESPMPGRHFRTNRDIKSEGKKNNIP